MKKLLILFVAILFITTGCQKDKVEPEYHMTVIYHGNGGQTSSGETNVKKVYLSSSCSAISNCFTNGDKVFSKWNTSANGNGDSYYPGSTIYSYEKLDLYALWLNKYQIRFNANGGSGYMSPHNVIQGESVRLNANTFTRNGYEFVKWNTQSDGGGTSYNDKANISPTSDMTLYAQWKKTHTITFNANGGSGTMSPQTCYDGESIQIRTNSFYMGGYVFARWNTKADGTGTWYTDNSYITLYSDITLYAHWDTYIEGPSFNMTSGGHKYMENGTYYRFFDSGGPENDYINDDNRYFTIHAPAGKKVKLQFLLFHTEPTHDYLQINGVNYSGLINDNPTIISSGSTMELYFHSDWYSTYYGWCIMVSSVY